VDEELRLARHDCEWLYLPVLPRAEPGDGFLVARVAGQVVAAETLDGEDPALVEHRHRLRERHRELRPADGAGDRLGVEAAVERVLVLPPALGA
jgi:hypothetical protein